MLTRCRPLLRGAALVMTAGLLSAAEPVQPALTKEIRRIRAEAGRVLPEAQQAPVTTRLDRAAAALEAQRYYLALYELESPWEITRSFGFAREASRIDSLQAFTARWKAIGEPRAAGAAPPGLPLAAEALATAAEARGPVVYRASLPYADDSDIASGLFYLGESQAVTAFGALVRSIAFPSAGPRPALRPLTAEIDALDAEMTTAYEGMQPSEHPAWIVASVTLKRARALNDQGGHAGALLEYLLARYRFGTLRKGPLPDIPAASALADARAALPAGADHSIAQLFVEMAEAALQGSTEAARRGAALIVGDVLPAYHAALRPASATTAADAAAVTITLVRWPFT